MAQAREEAHRTRAIEAARRTMAVGEQVIENGRVICADCGAPIPAGRLRARPDATRCVDCQAALEARP